MTVSQGGVDTFLFLFPRAGGVARPTHNEQSERPLLLYGDVFAAYDFVDTNKLENGQENWNEMGRGGNLDICFPSRAQEEERKGKGREGKGLCLAGRATSDERRRRAAAQQGEKERRAASLSGQPQLWKGGAASGHVRSPHLGSDTRCPSDRRIGPWSRSVATSGRCAPK